MSERDPYAWIDISAEMDRMDVTARMINAARDGKPTLALAQALHRQRLIEHDPYTEGGVNYGRYTVLYTIPDYRPWWRRLWPW